MCSNRYAPFLILRICICWMIEIKACFLLNILCTTKQVGIRRFLQYFLVFLFNFLNIKIDFFLCFFKISMFDLFYFPSYWNIVFLWILPWQEYIYYLVETPEYVWNMFQVTSKDTTTSMKAGFRRQLKADGLNLESDY